MTTPEHTLVGLHAALACGRDRAWGWRAVALAGLISNGPDWDGLPMLVNMARFEPGHRVWGHNLPVILLISLLVAAVLSCWDLIGGVGQRLGRRFGSSEAQLFIEQDSRPLGFKAAALTALVAQALHLPCDMVASGGHGLSHWHVQPFWPFSNAGFVYPMIPWGDPGPTIILMSGLIVMAQRRRQVAATSAATLFGLVAYLLVRRFVAA